MKKSRILLCIFCSILGKIIMAQEIDTKRSFITTDNANLYYQLFDTPESRNKTPIICLHGGPGSNQQYLVGLKVLAPQNPVILYDQSGCGKSTTNDPEFDDYNLEYYVSELKQFINKLNYDQVILLGHSWGAMLAVAYTLENPSKVKSLILSGACLSSPMWVADCKKLAQSLSPKLYEVMEKHEADNTTDDPEYVDAVDEFYANFFCRVSPWPTDLEIAISNINRKIYSKMWGNYETCATGNLKDVDLIPGLAKITVPTLFISGEYDTATPASMQYCANQMPNAKSVVIQGGAHATPTEKPVDFAKAVSEFLKELK